MMVFNALAACVEQACPSVTPIDPCFDAQSFECELCFLDAQDLFCVGEFAACDSSLP